VCLTILFVGLGISTYIDHFLALAIARLALPTSPSSAGSWVDNLYWVGTSRADVTRSRLQALNSVWSSPPTIHTSSVDFLGLAFDLATGLASIGPDLQRKLLESEHLSTTGCRSATPSARSAAPSTPTGSSDASRLRSSNASSRGSPPLSRRLMSSTSMSSSLLRLSQNSLSFRNALRSPHCPALISTTIRLPASISSRTLPMELSPQST
jgi:hypothetical protein